MPLLLDLFLTFFKIGAFTFGGGYAMLPLFRAETLAKGWANEAEIINFIAVSESTPGPFAINMSTYIGMEKDGFLGAFCATLGVVLPSFIIILIVARIFEKFKTNRIVRGCMAGLKPAVIGLIASAVISVGITVFFPHGANLDVFKNEAFYISLLIFALMTFLTFRFKKLHPILIICISAAIGIAAGYLFGIPPLSV